MMPCRCIVFRLLSALLGLIVPRAVASLGAQEVGGPSAAQGAFAWPSARTAASENPAGSGPNGFNYHRQEPHEVRAARREIVGQS